MSRYLLSWSCESVTHPESCHITSCHGPVSLWLTLSHVTLPPVMVLWVCDSPWVMSHYLLSWSLLSLGHPRLLPLWMSSYGPPSAHDLTQPITPPPNSPRTQTSFLSPILTHVCSPLRMAFDCYHPLGGNSKGAGFFFGGGLLFYAYSLNISYNFIAEIVICIYTLGLNPSSFLHYSSILNFLLVFHTVSFVSHPRFSHPFSTYPLVIHTLSFVSHPHFSHPFSTYPLVIHTLPFVSHPRFSHPFSTYPLVIHTLSFVIDYLDPHHWLTRSSSLINSIILID